MAEMTTQSDNPVGDGIVRIIGDWSEKTNLAGEKYYVNSKTDELTQVAPSEFRSKLIRTDEDIMQAVRFFKNDYAGALAKYGRMEDFDTSEVTSMKCLFDFNINIDISKWDTSKVTSMQHMFHGNRRFNQDISGWDVSNVTDMKWMFWRAGNFNQPIGKWDVSKVKDMDYMFYMNESFDQDIGNWKVSWWTKKADTFFRSKLMEEGHLPSWGPWCNGRCYHR